MFSIFLLSGLVQWWQDCTWRIWRGCPRGAGALLYVPHGSVECPARELTLLIQGGPGERLGEGVLWSGSGGDSIFPLLTGLKL